jgi:predicted N-acetyltransferase YhbS
MRCPPGRLLILRRLAEIERSMPHPIPVVVLGRLAVHKSFYGKGLGTGVLRDAVLRTLQAAETAGARAIFVHGISDAARRFNEKYGFVALPLAPMTVMITTAEAAKIVGGTF